MTKSEIFVPHQTTTQLFVPRTSCLKHQNSISSLKNHIQQKIIQYHKKIVMYCSALCCAVLLCIVLYST